MKIKPLGVFSLLVFCALWQILSIAGFLSPQMFPPLTSIGWGLVELFREGLPPGFKLPGHAGESLIRVAAGYFAALLSAIPIGLLMGWSRTFETLASPLFEMIRPIPPLAFIPLAVLWFGIGIKSAGAVIFLGAFFPILLNTFAGVRSVDKVIIEASRILGIKEWQLIIKVLLPGALPSILTGSMIAIGSAWMTLVAAEFVGVRSGYGLGHMIMTARDLQRTDLLIAGMAVIGFIGYALSFLLSLIERRLLKWR